MTDLSFLSNFIVLQTARIRAVSFAFFAVQCFELALWLLAISAIARKKRECPSLGNEADESPLFDRLSHPKIRV